MKTSLLISDIERELELIVRHVNSAPERHGGNAGPVQTEDRRGATAVNVRGIYDRMGESVPRVITVLTFFCEGGQELLEVLRDTRVQSESAALRRLAHSIKSLFQEVGAEVYATLAAEAESLAQQGKSAEAYEIIAGLPERILYTVGIVERLLNWVNDGAANTSH
jgi:HPt (histidine-containing phosphotransfer) domain-containing protein